MESHLEINRGGVNTIGQSGIGYIVIPDDATRQQYIDNCYRTHTVTINGGYGYGHISQVRIFPDVLQHIRFPSSSEELGTQVFWVRENFSNRPVVIGILSEDGITNLLNENQGRTVQQTNGKTVEIFQDAGSALLNIVVHGTTDTPGRITIKVASGSEDSEVRLVSDGRVTVDANEVDATVFSRAHLSLQNERGEEQFSFSGKAGEVRWDDKFGNAIIMNGDNVNIVPAKQFNFGDGSEPLVLGDTLVEELRQLIEAIKSIRVPTPQGVSGTPLNVATFTKIFNDIEAKIRSKISNLD